MKKKRLLSISMMSVMMLTSIPFASHVYANTPISLATSDTNTQEPLATSNYTNTSVAVAPITYANKPVSVEGAMRNESVGVSSIDIPATGEVVVTGVKDTKEPTSEDLERILKIVKSKINIPSKLSEFNYYFNAESYYSKAYWNLNWNEKDYNHSINIQCDQDGNIRYYSDNNYNEGRFSPKYLKSELKDTAYNFIVKVAPDIAKNIEFVDAQSQGTYSGNYHYQYRRVENGIPMPDNSVSVTVNYETGKVTSFNANWLYDIEIPSANIKIDKKVAAEKIGNDVKMELSYQNAYITDKNGKSQIKAFLVYTPDKSYIAVDAVTGEIYTTQNEWVDRDDWNEEGAKTADSSADAGGVLTEEEIEKLEELKGLISREEAIKVVTGNKSLLLDSNLKAITAKLYKQYNYYSSNQEDKYVWSINMSDPREYDYESGDYYRAYAYATVDAKTGKLINFNSSIKNYHEMTKDELESIKVKYSKEEGQKIFESFLKEQIPELYKNSVFTNNSDSYVIIYKDGQELSGGYSYNYERINEGIKYSYNGIYGSVDGVTGKIHSFSYNWNNNIVFEKPENIISAKKAFEHYIGNDGFHLVYEINNIHIYDKSNRIVNYTDSYSIENEVRLVYRTDISPNYISPFTGKQLGYDGEEYIKKSQEYSYSDIKDHPSARNIKLLADIGIGFKETNFFPNKAITVKELKDFLLVTDYGYNSNKYITKKDNAKITREEAAKYSVQLLGYDNVAQLKGIYNLDCKDIDQINEANIGYAALAHGLGLITYDSNKELKPNQELTRAEAADMIVGMLFVDR